MAKPVRFRTSPSGSARNSPEHHSLPGTRALRQRKPAGLLYRTLLCAYPEQRRQYYAALNARAVFDAIIVADETVLPIVTGDPDDQPSLPLQVGSVLNTAQTLARTRLSSYILHVMLIVLVVPALLLGKDQLAVKAATDLQADFAAAPIALRQQLSADLVHLTGRLKQDATGVVGQSDAYLPSQVEAPDQSGPVFIATHTTSADETLGQIAEQYGLPLATIIWSNGLEYGDVLVAGDQLRIPRLAGIPYTISADDTIEGIAEYYKVPLETILYFGPNQLDPFAPLPVGREIFVPGGTAPYPEALREIYSDDTQLAEMTAVQTAAVILDNQTNLRKGPGTKYDKVVQLNAGRRMEILARHEDWLQVQVPGKGKAWVMSDLMDLEMAALEQIPETNDFPPPPVTTVASKKSNGGSSGQEGGSVSAASYDEQPAVSSAWVWPSYGSVTSGFGSRWGGFHNGLDIANAAWTPIVAARSGRVYMAGWCSGYGYCVMIDHGDGITTEYGHMVDYPPVSVGQYVSAGQLIGFMGSTYDLSGGGYSTGVHLHFTVKIGGQAINPYAVLP